MSERSEHKGHRERLRERFLAGELCSRSDEALLELLLTYAIPQKDVQPLAKKLIGRFGSLQNVLAAPTGELFQIVGLKQTSIVLLKASYELLLLGGLAKTGLIVPPTPEHTAKTPALIQQVLMPQVLNPVVEKLHPSKGASSRVQLPRSGAELFGKALVRDAIKMAPDLPDTQSIAAMRDFLAKNLHYSSDGTRRRYSSYITRRLFPSGVVDSSLLRFAQVYRDSTELKDVCFFRFCQAEPLMPKLIKALLIPGLGLGRVSRLKIKTYLAAEFPSAGGIVDATKAIVEALDSAGIVKANRKELAYGSRPITMASFAFILHSEFPEPGIYDIEKAERNLYFSCLLWDPDQIPNALYECRNRGWISKVSQIDNVRQFTLRYRLDEVVALLAKEAEKR